MPSPRSHLEHGGQPGGAAGQDPVQLGDEGRVRRVRQVGEQVHAVAVVLGADLHAADQVDADLPGGALGLGPALRGVVVGQRHHVESGGRGGAHQLLRGLRAVAGPRVGVEVDAHAERLGRRRSGLTRAAPDPRTASPAAAARGPTRPAGSSRRGAAGWPRPAAARSTASARGPRRATTERSSSPSAVLTLTAHSGTGWFSIRTRTVGGPSPTSPPGSSCGVPAQRAPSPVPASSVISTTSTGPSSSLVPEVQVRVASARSRPSPTAAKSVTRQPGLSGQGRYVGKPVDASRCAAKASYDASFGRHSGVISPCSGQAQPGPGPARVSTMGVEQRGQPAASDMRQRWWCGGASVKSSSAG